jgi:hypothetical protein
MDVTDLNEDFVVKLQQLVAAAAADGITLDVSSGYRDVAEQTDIFLERYEEDPSGSVDWNGTKWTLKPEYQGQPAAPPGESLHNFGYAVDFANAQPGTPAAAWLVANVEQFGLRTYAQGGEPNHVAPAEITHVSQIPEAQTEADGVFQWDDVLQHQTGPPDEGSRAATSTSAGTGSYATGPGGQGGPTSEHPPVTIEEAQAAIDAAAAGLDLSTHQSDALAAVLALPQADPDQGGSGFLGAVSTATDDAPDEMRFEGGPDATGFGGMADNPYGYPAGFTLYNVDGTRYLVYEVSDAGNLNSASASIYYALPGPDPYLGESQWMSRSAWNQTSLDYVDGGAASVLLDDDHIGRSWDQIMSSIIAGDMNMAGTDATSDVGIMHGLAELIADPDMGEAEQTALWVGTDWYDAHTLKQLAWNDYGTAEKNLKIEEAATNLLTVTEYYTGTPADTTFMYGTDGQFSVALLQQRNPDLYQNAFDLASGAATQVGLVGSVIKPMASDIDQSPHNRRLDEEVRLQGMRDMGIAAARSSVVDLYEQYGLQASGYTIDTAISKLYMNQMSLDEIETTVKNHSLAKYPNKPLEMDWATYAEPYKDSFSSLLELPRPGFQDPTLARYLQRPAVEGQGMPNVHEFEQQLRRDPRWENTKNAKDSYHSAFGQIGRLMGLG